MLSVGASPTPLIHYLAAQETVYAYDANGNRVTVTDAYNKTTTSAFDALNRITSVTSPITAAAAKQYDYRDNQTRQSDPRSMHTNYVFNGFNQVIQIDSPDAGKIIYNTVDKAGNIVQETDARGVVTNRTFDALNRPLTQTYPASTAENIAYTYDATAGSNKGKGRLTSYTDQSGSTSFVYDSRGNVLTRTSIVNGKTYTTTYTYNLSDKPLVTTYPSGRQVQNVYDAHGRLTAVNSRATSGGSYAAVASSIVWEPFGPLKSFTYGNGLTHARGYDQNYWPSTIETKDGATFLQNLTYTLDNNGNITAIADGVTPARNQSFTQDAIYRLTQGIGAYGTVDYSYFNEIIRWKRSTGGIDQITGVPGTSSRILYVTSSPGSRWFTYDNAGNVLTDDRSTAPDVAYTWNHRNRKSTVTVGGTLAATYLYNAEGQRVSKVAGATTTHYVYDLSGNLIAEANGSTGATTREYIWLPDGKPLAQIEPSSVFWYMLTDHQGTPQKLVDAAKAVVWDRVQQPYGEQVSVTGAASTNLRFPGQYYDAEDGNHYNYYRDYAPTIGRYLQPDPIGQAGGLNLYLYAEYNPLKWMDAKGLRPLTDSEKFYLKEYFPQNTLESADIHTDGLPSYVPSAKPGEVRRGFTKYNDIYFREGQTFTTPSDLALLGHELFHVGQYAANPLSFPAKYLFDANTRQRYEDEAYLMQDNIENDLYERYGAICPSK